jgi:hypothetical protein
MTLLWELREGHEWIATYCLVKEVVIAAEMIREGIATRQGCRRVEVSRKG